MEKTVVTISIWQKPSVHIISLHWFLIAVALMCWEACPACPLLILTDSCRNIHAAAYTATLRQTYRVLFHPPPHTSCLMLHRQELANYIWAGSCSINCSPHIYHYTQPVFFMESPAVLWHEKDTSVRIDNVQWHLEVMPDSSPPTGSVFVIELLYYLAPLRFLKRKWLSVNSAADSNNRLVKRQPAFCPYT